MLVSPFITAFGAHELSNSPFRKKLAKGIVSLIPAPFKPWEAKSMDEYIRDTERWSAGQALDEALGPEFAALRLAGDAIGLDPGDYNNAIQGHPDKVATTEIGVGNDPWAGMSEEEMRRATGMLPPKDDTKDDTSDTPDTSDKVDEPEQDFPPIERGEMHQATM